MANKKDEQRIEELQDKIKKLEAQKKQLEARAKERARKERTRELIQIGAIIQSIDEVGFHLKEDAEKFKDYVTCTEQGQHLLKEYLEYHQEQLKKECDQMDEKINHEDNSGAAV
jgi:phage shock protein A